MNTNNSKTKPLDKTTVMRGCPTFVEDNDTHSVVYIEYVNKIPYLVRTVTYIPNAVNGPYWRLFDWDFECADGDENDLIAYNCGSGGCEKDIDAPNFVKNKNIKEVWVADGIVLREKGENFTLIKELIELKNEFNKSTNPFDIAEIVYSIDYCPKCKTYSRDFCDEHLYYDNEGNARYRGNHKYVSF
jgi:hypothetical protein